MYGKVVSALKSSLEFRQCIRQDIGIGVQQISTAACGAYAPYRSNDDVVTTDKITCHEVHGADSF